MTAMPWQNRHYRGDPVMLHCELCHERRPAHAQDCPTPIYATAEELELLEQRQEGRRQ